MKQRKYEDLERIVVWLNKRNRIDEFNIKDNEFVICPTCWGIHRESYAWGQYCNRQCWKERD